MAAPRFVPSPTIDDARAYSSPPTTPEAWMPGRKAELVGFQPVGEQGQRIDPAVGGIVGGGMPDHQGRFVLGRVVGGGGRGEVGGREGQRQPGIRGVRADFEDMEGGDAHAARMPHGWGDDF